MLKSTNYLLLFRKVTTSYKMSEFFNNSSSYNQKNSSENDNPVNISSMEGDPFRNYDDFIKYSHFASKRNIDHPTKSLQKATTESNTQLDPLDIFNTFFNDSKSVDPSLSSVPPKNQNFFSSNHHHSLDMHEPLDPFTYSSMKPSNESNQLFLNNPNDF